MSSYTSQNKYLANEKKGHVRISFDSLISKMLLIGDDNPDNYYEMK